MGTGESRAISTPRPNRIFYYTRKKEQQEALTLCWIRKSSVLYSALSTNVIREVFCYMNGNPLLVSVLQTKLHTFDCRLTLWHPMVNLSEAIDADKYTASVVVNESEIFACGGGSNYSRACLIKHGYVTRLSSMNEYRQFPGVFYDASTDSVLVFGGSNGKRSLEKCERYYRALQCWVRMPDMIDPRRQFNACGYRQFVYLCGGWANTIETYDLIVDAFHIVQQFNLPEAKWGTAVMANNLLVVISENYVCKWNLLTEEKEFEARKPAYNAWSRCTPVVLENRVFVLGQEERLARVISLDTGEVVQKI